MDVTVRIDSCIVAEDGSHLLVNAVLPDGARVVNAQLPMPQSTEDLALKLIAYDGPRYRLANQFTGNIKVTLPDAAPATEAEPVAAEPAVEPTPVGVSDGAKGKQK